MKPNIRGRSYQASQPVRLVGKGGSRYELGQPDLSDIHVDAVLTNVSIASMNEMDMFVADKVFPRVPVSKTSDKYFIYDQSFLMRSEAKPRADGTPAAIRGHGVTTGTYTTTAYAVKEKVTWKERDEADPGIDPDRDATDIVTHDLMLKKENVFLDAFLTTSVWTDQTITTKWDQASSTPITDIDTGVQTIKNKLGKGGRFITLLLAGAVWNVLKRHADILNAFGGGNSSLKIATTQMVADLLGIKQVIIADAAENTGIEGGTAAYSEVAGTHGLLIYTPDRPGPKTPSGGYTFDYTTMEIRRYSDDEIKADWIEGEIEFAHELTMAAAGVLLNDPIT